MRTVGTRELKQNPNVVVKRVLETGEEFEITAYGRATGVKIVPDKPTKARWVPGAALAAVAPMSRDEAEVWTAEVDAVRDDDPVRDPWGSA